MKKEKCDPILGEQIKKYLLYLGLETPMIESKYTEDEKVEKIKEHYLDIMKILGLDYTNDSMVDTPKRIAKLMVKETMYGLNYNYFPKIMTFENSFHDAGMVVEKGIKVNSLCSHHFVPTIGHAVIAYIPNKKILGLSKLNRCVDFFARRPQEQERFTMQLHATLNYILDTDDVAVYVDAKHLCVSWRGALDPDSKFVTAKLSGSFMNNSLLRNEFYSIARN